MLPKGPAHRVVLDEENEISGCWSHALLLHPPVPAVASRRDGAQHTGHRAPCIVVADARCAMLCCGQRGQLQLVLMPFDAVRCFQ